MNQQSSGEVQVLRNLHGALQLLIRGAAQVLTEQYNVAQPEADIMTLQTLFNQLDDLVDLPTLLTGPVISAIRVSVENDHADALAAMAAEASDQLEAEAQVQQRPGS